jgi:hypothetical protein
MCTNSALSGRGAEREVIMWISTSSTNNGPENLCRLHQSPLYPPFSVPFQNRTLYMCEEIHRPTHFDFEDEGSMYIRNVSNCAHNHMVQQHRES